MDQDTKKEFQGLHKRFEQTDKRFDKHDKKFEDILNFLYKNMPTKADLGELATKGELAASKNEILTAIDGLAKQVKTYHQEMIMLSRRIERIEAWIKKVENKVGVKFEW